jgi:DNA-binding NtrC family response regulator
MSRDLEAFHVGRVLLVTDDPCLERGVTRGLSHQGLSVQAVQTAKQAVHLLAREGFEFIVADEPLLGMSGRELIEEVRLRFPKIKRVLLVGTRVGMAAPTDHAPGADILNRRCTPAQLLGLIRRRMEPLPLSLRPLRSLRPTVDQRESLSPSG